MITKTRKAIVENIHKSPDGWGEAMKLSDGTVVSCSKKLPTPGVGDTVKIETVSGGIFHNIDHHCE